ncbi:hypothetical protein FQR65_LT11986 [Abscondita terminalis]|nr:hypothetical protein FQR65_LT11986 [Abscondita terminalis]
MMILQKISQEADQAEEQNIEEKLRRPSVVDEPSDEVNDPYANPQPSTSKISVNDILSVPVLQKKKSQRERKHGNAQIITSTAHITLGLAPVKIDVELNLKIFSKPDSIDCLRLQLEYELWLKQWTQTQRVIKQACSNGLESIEKQVPKGKNNIILKGGSSDLFELNTKNLAAVHDIRVTLCYGVEHFGAAVLTQLCWDSRFSPKGFRCQGISAPKLLGAEYSRAPDKEDSILSKKKNLKSHLDSETVCGETSSCPNCLTPKRVKKNAEMATVKRQRTNVLRP